MTSPTIQLPSALTSRLKNQLPGEFDLFLKALQESPPTSIRLNPGKPTQQFADSEPIPWETYGKYLNLRPRFTDDPLFHAGTYYVQEASSMFLAHVVTSVIDLNQNLRVLDLSAAPGGKATHLQSLLTKDSVLVANEIIASRNKILRQNLTRWGGDNHIVTQSDPKYFKKLPNFFDLILVDAPCSGEGLMRKDPGAIQEWSPDIVTLCTRRQRRILADIVPSLGNGGVLIYSTCTFSEEENEENMEWLMQESGMIPISFDIPQSWGVVHSGPEGAGNRFYPHLTRGEGFFISAFRKTEIAKSVNIPRSKSLPAFRSESATQEDQKWLHAANRYTFINRDAHRIALPKAIYEDYLRISRSLRITHAGLYMGKVYHSQLKPSPELALSQWVSKQLQIVELSTEKALDYLAHINHVPDIDYSPGFKLIVYGGYGLGWLHVLETGQVRNKYPAAWRILQRHSKNQQ